MAVFYQGQRIDAIGFDADDTLWHNESLYQESQRDLECLLELHAAPQEVRDHLLMVEQRNLSRYGYGVKSFVLSMIETAIERTDGSVGGATIERILGLGRRMLSAEVELLPGVRETIERLAKQVPLWLITKGDLRDQQVKLDRSGLKEFFQTVAIVSEKTIETYARILEENDMSSAGFLMVGNSPRSDIEPVLALGAHAVQVPYHVLWEHENSSRDSKVHESWHVLSELSELPSLLGLEP